MSAAKLSELQKRRHAFLEVRDELRARLKLLEERFVDAMLAGEPMNRAALVDARAQLAIAEADVAMIDQVLDRWQLVH